MAENKIKQQENGNAVSYTAAQKKITTYCNTNKTDSQCILP